MVMGSCLACSGDQESSNYTKKAIFHMRSCFICVSWSPDQTERDPMTTDTSQLTYLHLEKLYGSLLESNCQNGMCYIWYKNLLVLAQPKIALVWALQCLVSLAHFMVLVVFLGPSNPILSTSIPAPFHCGTPVHQNPMVQNLKQATCQASCVAAGKLRVGLFMPISR
jgi:hypothetical protein